MEDSFLGFIEEDNIFVIFAIILGERHIATETRRIIVFILLDDFLCHIFHVVFGYIAFLAFRDFVDFHQVFNRVAVDVQVKSVFAALGSGVLGHCRFGTSCSYIIVIHYYVIRIIKCVYIVLCRWPNTRNNRTQ